MREPDGRRGHYHQGQPADAGRRGVVVMSGVDKAADGAADKAAETPDAEARAAAELDALLDEALKETFPASDPISVALPQPRSSG
jgi:hypothetical protein